MKTSRRFKKQRQFFDVVEHPSARPKRFFPRFSKGFLVNLRPHFFRRFPLITASGLLLIFLGAFFGRDFFIKAESATFYPQTCLGTWRNAILAQAQPESVSMSGSIDGSNAAIYPGNREDIFCGGFVGNDSQELGSITHVGVTLAWRIGEEVPVASGTPGVFLPLPPETESTSSSESSITEEATTTEAKPATSEESKESSPVLPAEEAVIKEESREETPVASPAESSASAPVEETPPPTPAPEPVSEPVVTPVAPEASLFNIFISRAFAEEIVSSESTTAEVIVPLGPPIQAVIEELPSSTEKIEEMATSTTETPIKIETEVLPPDNNFLMVSYSFDSSNWTELGKVNVENWRQLTFSLPVSSWAELRNLQIRVQGISSTVDPLPPVFLDGMLLEVHYDKGILEDPNDKPEVVTVAGPASVSPEELQMTQSQLQLELDKDIRVAPHYKEKEWITFNAREGEQYEVYLKNEATGEIKRLTTTPSNETYPVIKNGQVAWAYSEGSTGRKRGEIFLYDIASQITIQVTDDEFVDELPDFDEQGVLSWQKTDAAGVTHGFRYDLAERKVHQIDTTPFTTVAPLDEGGDNL